MQNDVIERVVAALKLARKGPLAQALSSEISRLTAELLAAKDCEKIAERDGFERAVQQCDIMTGGDGEYFAATIGDDCRDPAAMMLGMRCRYESLTLRAETAEAERDAALAQVAAAFEAANDTVRGVWGRCEKLEDEAYDKLEKPIENDHARGFYAAQKMVAKSLRRSTELLALSPADSLASLDQVKRQAKAEGMREAAEICRSIRRDPGKSEVEAVVVMDCAVAILARAELNAAGREGR